MEFPCCYRWVLMGFPFASSWRLLSVVITDAVHTCVTLAWLALQQWEALSHAQRGTPHG